MALWVNQNLGKWLGGMWRRAARRLSWRLQKIEWVDRASYAGTVDKSAGLTSPSLLLSPHRLLLMDQGVVAGVGNIYRAEILFKAGVHPVRQDAVENLLRFC